MQKNISKHIYQKYFKRAFDIILSFIILLIILPLFITILIILSFQHKGNPLFLQTRPGLNEKPFQVIKFKTMDDKKDSNGDLLPNNMRMTKFGEFLRKFSLDELPQFINVIKGDMSLVGPRPLLFKYISLYSERQKKRHLVLPGITGWAQVNGRNEISWTKKFELDVLYVENISFLLDIKIILMTILKAITSEGINADENTTMPPFNGIN